MQSVCADIPTPARGSRPADRRMHANVPVTHKVRLYARLPFLHVRPPDTRISHPPHSPVRWEHLQHGFGVVEAGVGDHHRQRFLAGSCYTQLCLPDDDARIERLHLAHPVELPRAHAVTPERRLVSTSCQVGRLPTSNLVRLPPVDALAVFAASGEARESPVRLGTRLRNIHCRRLH